MLTVLAGLLVVSAHDHTSVFRVLATLLQKLGTHGPEVLLALVAVGAFGLLAGIAGLSLVKVMKQTPLH